MPRLLAALLLCASAAIHWPPATAELTFDDREFVQQNASIRSLPEALRGLLSPFPPEQPEHGRYRPLTNLSYALEWALHGGAPRGFHATNVLIYLACVGLVHALALRYLRRPSTALAAALLFSLHPVHGEAVDAVAGRSELLALTLSLLSLWLLLRHLRFPFVDGAESGARGAFSGSLLAYALACLAKETAVVLPAVAGAHLLFFHVAPGARRPLPARRAAFLLAPYAAVAAIYGVARWMALGELTPDLDVLAGLGPLVRAQTAAAVFFEYVRLLVLPVELQIDYVHLARVGIPARDPVAALAGGLLLAAASAALLGLAAGRLARRGRAAPPAPDMDSCLPLDRDERLSLLAFALFACLVFLLPVSHVVGIGALLAERFLFAPSFGFTLLVAALAAGALDGRAARRAPAWRAIAVGALACVLVLGAVRSGVRAAEWRDPVRLWRSAAVRAGDDPRVHANLGAAYLARRELDAAARALRRALELEPDHVEAINNLGWIHLESGRPDLARALYARSLELEPENTVALNNLGVIETRRRNHARARILYGLALESNPNHAAARANLAEAERVIAEALAYLDARPEPGGDADPEARRIYALACYSAGLYACAERLAPGPPAPPAAGAR